LITGRYLIGGCTGSSLGFGRSLPLFARQRYRHMRMVGAAAPATRRHRMAASASMATGRARPADEWQGGSAARHAARGATGGGQAASKASAGWRAMTPRHRRS